MNGNTSGYQLRLPGFEGPLDLLHQLIERRQLDVTAVSLALVTEQYLEYLWSMGGADLNAWSSFLVVAARLLLLKSRRLLPEPAKPAGADEGQEEDPGEALVRQLLEFRRFRPAVALLRARDEQGLRSYPRLAPPPKLGPPPLAGVNLADLQAALRKALRRQEPLPVVVQPQAINIADMVRRVQESLQREGRVPFSRLLAGCPSRLEVVVTFLAILELVKRGEVVARQEGVFGEILLVRDKSPSD